MTGAGGDPRPPEEAPAAVAPPRPPRPLVERIGLFALAVVFGLMFGALAVVSYFGGELFMTVLGLIGAFMTLWVGLLTLLRG